LNVDVISVAMLVATAAIAAAGAILALAARQQVAVSRASVAVAQRHLDVVQTQLEVTLKQMRPMLELTVPNPDPEALNATVMYMCGTLPAHNVDVWVFMRTVLYGAHVGSVGPRTDPEPVRLGRVPDDMDRRWDDLFADVRRGIELRGNHWWAAVTWNAPDGTPGRWMFVARDHSREFNPIPLKSSGVT
jgi:hypothetical protein